MERVGQELDNPDSGAIALPIISYSTATVHGAQYLENHFISYASGFTCVFCLFVWCLKNQNHFIMGFAVERSWAFFLKCRSVLKMWRVLPSSVQLTKVQPFVQWIFITEGPLVRGSRCKNGKAMSRCDTVWETAGCGSSICHALWEASTHPACTFFFVVCL